MGYDDISNMVLRNDSMTVEFAAVDTAELNPTYVLNEVRSGAADVRLRHICMDDTLNCTNQDDAQTLYSTEDVLFYCYYFLLIFLVSSVTVFGNLLIIQAMVKRRHLRTPTNYFLFSLAVSDLLLGLVYPIYNVSHMDLPDIRETLGLWPSCEITLTVTLALLFISSYNLVGITITRYLSIRDPLRFPLNFTRRRALASVVVTWVSLCLISCAIYIRGEPEGYTGQCRYERVLKKYDIIITTCFYVLTPLLIMTLLYGHMTIIARKQIHIIVTQQVVCGRYPGLSQRELILRRELRMFKMAGSLLGYFTLAWMPFVIFEYCSILQDKEVDRWIRATVRIVLHSNTAVNVLIYSGRLYEFRQAIKANLQDLRASCGLRPKC